MQPIGPYRTVRALGTCPVGGVWSAVDHANNQVTVAMLNETAANDAGWRRAFAATATALAQSRQVPLIAADYSGQIPWVASAARDGSVLGQVFTAVGMDYQPVTEPAQPIATAPASPAGPPRAMAEQTPGGEEPTHRVSVGQPTSSPPWQPPSPAAPAYENPLVRSPHAASPFGATPPEPPRRRRRTGLVIGLMVLVIALLIGAGLAIVVWPDEGGPAAQQSSEPTTPTAQEPTLPAPSQPGSEPPQEGEWPADWPVFGADEPISRVRGLIGERNAQIFELPEGWECASVATVGSFAHYSCGPGGEVAEIGGDLIIRSCPDPCDEGRREQLRTEIDAWGLQWVRDSSFRSWAETTELEDGARYGLVFVAYYRTRPEGRLDRQLVLRMTGPLEQADELRKIGNSVRDATQY